MTQSKSGRPPIGTQVSVTLPNEILAAVGDIAATTGQDRSAVLRGIITRAVAEHAAPAEPPATENLEVLRPVAALIATWIAADHAQSRDRFKRYYKDGQAPRRLLQLLMDAAADQVRSGQDAPRLDPAAIALLAPPDAWRPRALLHWAVMAALAERGVTLGMGIVGEPLPDPDFGHALDEDGDYA